MGLLIKGGEIVTAESRSRGDIFIENETISSIGRDFYAPPGTEVIDAAGQLVFPGFIDPHVHIHLPFMATFAKDTHATASKAALIGGTTTFIEMCCPSRTEDALEGYHTWKQKAQGNSACDYAFHMAVTRYDTNTEAQLREIVRDGTASFKIFLAYKNFFGVTDEEMFSTLKLAAELASCSRFFSPKARPARSGMNPAALRLLKPKAPAASRLFLGRPAPPATWFIFPVRPR